MSGEHRIELCVNGETVAATVEPRMTLADVLRERLELTGTHLGCEMGSCGACLVLLDGQPVHACLVLAVQAEGSALHTIEGLDESGAIADLQAAFLDRNAFQCGFCTPGMLIAAHALLAENEAPDRPAIREAISGNFCRCTGYEAIVDAVAEVAETRAADAAPEPRR